MALCPSVCSSQVAAQPITVVCNATRVYMPILGGIVWTFYHLLCKKAGPIDVKASNRLRYTLSVFITFSPHIIDIVSLKQLFLIRTLQYWLFYLNYIPSNLEFSLSPFAHSKSDIPSKNITKPVLSTCNIPANQALLFHLKLTDYDNSCFTNLHHINHSHKSTMNIYH